MTSYITKNKQQVKKMFSWEFHCHIIRRINSSAINYSAHRKNNIHKKGNAVEKKWPL